MEFIIAVEFLWAQKKKKNFSYQIAELITLAQWMHASEKVLYTNSPY